MRRRVSQLLFLAALAAGQAGWADDAPPDYAADTLTGDWSGLRAGWLERGLAVELGLKSDWLRNHGGGLSDGGSPMHHLDVKLDADLERLWGWTATRAYVNFIYDWGDSVNGRHVGSLIGVSNIEWPIHTSRFFQAWLERSFLDDRVGVLVGLYPFDSEFSVVESAGLFLNPSFGASPDVSLTRGPSIFNNSAFGTRVKWRSADESLYLQGALLDGVPGDPDRPRGTHVKFAKGDGSFHIVEVGWRPADDARPAGADAHDAPERFAKLAAGYWGYTARVDDLVDRNAFGEPEKRSSHGWYVLAEKTVWHDAARRGRNLAAFARFCATDGDSTAIKDALNLGLRLRSPLASRPDDVFGIAYTRARIGAKFHQAQTAAGVDATPEKSLVEVTYRAAISKWLAVQPAVQRIRHPGADRALADTTVYGARLEVLF